MMSKTVTIEFDPRAASDEVKAVFGDDVARTLWLAVKPSHITTENFSTSCIYLANAIRDAKAKGPLTAEDLLFILTVSVYHRIVGFEEIDFVADLLPFINDEETLEFVVSSVETKVPR